MIQVSAISSRMLPRMRNGMAKISKSKSAMMMGTLDIIANANRPKKNLNVYRTMISSLRNTSRFVCVEDRFLLRCFFPAEGVGIEDDGLNGIGICCSLWLIASRILEI